MATTVLAIAAVVGVLAAAGSAYAAYRASEAQAASARFQKRQADINAKQARDAAAAAADVARERNQRVLAAQRAALGASGVSTTEGSSLILQADAAIEAKLDEERIRAAGETASTGFASTGKLLKYQAREIETAGYIGAGTTLLGGASSAGTTYYGRSTK